MLLLLKEIALRHLLLYLHLLLLLTEEFVCCLTLCVYLHLDLLQVLHVLIWSFILVIMTVLRSLILGKCTITSYVVIKSDVLRRLYLVNTAVSWSRRKSDLSRGISLIILTRTQKLLLRCNHLLLV